MIAESIIPRGYAPSHECWMWLHSEHRRVLQLECQAYDSGNYANGLVLLKFESMLWQALMECTDAHSRATDKLLAEGRATDKLLAEGKALLAAVQSNSETPDYSGIPF